MHDGKPTEVEYVPALHRVQIEAVTPTLPYDPAAQAMPEHVAAAADVEPTGPYWPGKHCAPLQLLEPVVAVNVPLGHCVIIVPPAQ